MSHESAMKAVLTLLACYPNTKADEKFVKMATMALAHYSDDTLRAMIDPKDGIVNDYHYLPSISQMKDFCRKYTDVPQKPRYVTFDDPIPASPESKAKIDEIVASIQWSDYRAPVKVTEKDLEALKDKYATLTPPKFSDSAQRAIIEDDQFREMFGKRMPK
jgi:hypothetical protein